MVSGLSHFDPLFPLHSPSSIVFPHSASFAVFLMSFVLCGVSFFSLFLRCYLYAYLLAISSSCLAFVLFISFFCVLAYACAITHCLLTHPLSLIHSRLRGVFNLDLFSPVVVVHRQRFTLS